MKITIITPTFNSKKTVLKTLESIRKQTFKDYHHLLIDNLSTDGTLELVSTFYENKHLSFGIHSEGDQGISDAFNKGIKRVSSEIVGILNSDDEYYDDQVLENVARAFEDPDVDFVHGDMLFIDELHGTNVRKPLLCPLTHAMPFNHPTMFFRKRVYDQIGFFDLSYRYAMDFELVCRMYNDPQTCRFKGIYLQGSPFVKMHAGGVSWNHELRSIDEVERALKEHGFWDSVAARAQNYRRKRIKLKQVMTRLKLNPLIKLWRKFKWS